MPMGPWPDFQACMADPALVKKYPDDPTRQRVCGAIRARMEGDAVRGGDHGDAAGLVTDAGAYWIVEGNKAASEGVNGNSQLKTWGTLVAGKASLDGVPFVWRHPKDAAGRPLVFVPPDHPEVAGHAVNVRLDEEGHRLLYDLILFKAKPRGYNTTPEALRRNADAVKVLESGGVIHNSVGYMALTDDTPGVWRAPDGVGKPYRENQVVLTFGHVAGLSPIIPEAGACTPEDGCGLGVDGKAGEGHDCDGGEGCCRTRAAAAARVLMADAAATPGGALYIVARGVPPKP